MMSIKKKNMKFTMMMEGSCNFEWKDTTYNAIFDVAVAAAQNKQNKNPSSLPVFTHNE